MSDSADIPMLRPIFYMVGMACIMISMAWVLQALFFGGDNSQAASMVWIILGAAIAGVGAAFLIAGRYWMRPEL